MASRLKSYGLLRNTTSQAHTPGPEYKGFFGFENKTDASILVDGSEEKKVSRRGVREASVRNERLGDRSQPIDEVELRRAQGDASGKMNEGRD